MKVQVDPDQVVVRLARSAGTLTVGLTRHSWSLNPSPGSWASMRVRIWHRLMAGRWG